MSYTIFSIAKDIKELADNIPLIKQTYIGELTDIYELEAAQYPFCFISYTNSNYDGFNQNIQYSIIIADLQIQGDTNLFQIYSDMGEIAFQLLSEIDREIFDINITSNNIEPFKDYNNDNFAGVILTLNIQIPKPYNNC